MGTHTNTRKKQGFTLIELILVLGVTSVMIVTFLVGMNSSIDTQRYRDAVVTFRNSIQSEYDKLSSVRNERTNGWSCNTNAVTTQEGATTDRGQSNCQMIGRLITIDGKNITKHALIGSERVPVTDTDTDLQILKDKYSYSSVESMKETSILEWDTQIAYAVSGVDAKTPQVPRVLSILLLRSPKTGQIYTFTENKIVSAPNSTTLASMMVTENSIPGRGQRVICVSSDGLTKSTMAITIAARAASGSAVESRTNESMTGLAKC